MQDLRDESLLDWRQFIHSDPDILCGKPVLKGTRLAHAFLLDLCAAACAEEEVIGKYPQLTREGLRAVFVYAADRIGADTMRMRSRQEWRKEP